MKKQTTQEKILANEQLARVRERQFGDVGWKLNTTPQGDYWMHQGLGWAVSSSGLQSTTQLDFSGSRVYGDPETSPVHFYRTFKLRVWGIIPGGTPAYEVELNPLGSIHGYSRRWMQEVLTNSILIVAAVMRTRHSMKPTSPSDMGHHDITVSYNNSMDPNARGPIDQLLTNDQLSLNIKASDHFKGLVVENIAKRIRLVMHTGGMFEWEGKTRYFKRFGMGHPQKLWEHRLTTDQMIFAVDAIMGDEPMEFANFKHFEKVFCSIHGTLNP